MSRTADIDLVFEHAVTVAAVVGALAGERWSLEEPLGVSYMVNSDGLYNWQSAPTDQVTRILALVDSPDNIHHHVGVCIYSSAAKTGGQLLFMPAVRTAPSSRRSTGGASPERQS
ncbi:hypothetical protein [Streptomyces sp900116325]|uniref:hypothetical protein n=1 Tax=Streptomyces sp. 900116325 TaxID=3154295 RepID=UPI0033D0CB32